MGEDLPASLIDHRERGGKRRGLRSRTSLVTISMLNGASSVWRQLGLVGSRGLP